MELGIVGLPNVGKSSLFNLLTANSVPAENYPFCTVKPNVGVVSVPDHRLDKIAGWVASSKTTPASVRFVDVAGLVKDASKGEGLGNQFLSQIRGVSAVCHVVRLFEDRNVSHVEGTVDPLRDIQIIETEFMLSDLELVEREIKRLEKQMRVKGGPLDPQLKFMKELEQQLSRGERLSFSDFPPERQKTIQRLSLLSFKPVLYLLNVDEGILAEGEKNPVYREVKNYIENQTAHRHVTICVGLESEMQGMEEEEKLLFLDDLGFSETGLRRLIRSAYELLDLISFFTYNSNELRAWSLSKGKKAPEAAGKIHSDFQRGFISADTINYHRFKKFKSWEKAREAGGLRTVGKDYQVIDGDILLFRYNL